MIEATEIPVGIKICSRQREMPLYKAETEKEKLQQSPACEEASVTELYAEGSLYADQKRITLEYEETELTGMEGARTRLFFAKRNPGLVSLSRDGTVKTAMHFEKDRRHITAYQTEYLACELCVYTYALENRISNTGGTLQIRYDLEIKGACIEKTELSLEIFPLKKQMPF